MVQHEVYMLPLRELQGVVRDDEGDRHQFLGDFNARLAPDDIKAMHELRLGSADYPTRYDKPDLRGTWPTDWMRSENMRWVLVGTAAATPAWTWKAGGAMEQINHVFLGNPGRLGEDGKVISTTIKVSGHTKFSDHAQLEVILKVGDTSGKTFVRGKPSTPRDWSSYCEALEAKFGEGCARGLVDIAQAVILAAAEHEAQRVRTSARGGYDAGLVQTFVVARRQELDIATRRALRVEIRKMRRMALMRILEAIDRALQHAARRPSQRG